MIRFLFVPIVALLLIGCKSKQNVVETTRIDGVSVFNTSRYAVLDDVITVFDLVASDSGSTEKPVKRIERHATMHGADTISANVKSTVASSTEHVGPVHQSPSFYAFIAIIALFCFILLVLNVLLLRFLIRKL